jgi:hypothetical protein
MGVPGHPNPRLKNQMPFTAEGVYYPEGFGVIERKVSTKISVKLPDKTTVVLVNSCARQLDTWNPDPKKPFEYLYSPAMDFENKGICPIYVTAVTSQGEFHRSVLGPMNTPAYPAEVDVQCNGAWVNDIKSGSYMCQVAEGLPVGIRSRKRAVIAKAESADHCAEPVADKNVAQDKGWVITARIPETLRKPGICVYVLKDEDKREFAFMLSAYSSILNVFPPTR